MLRMLLKILKYRRLTFKYPKAPMDSKFFAGKPVIKKDKCIKCGECINACPSYAIERYGDNGEVGINLDQCIFCTACEEVCPNKAINITNEFELAEKSRDSLRVSKAIIDDKLLYEDLELLGERVKEKVNKLFGRSLQIREVDAGSCNGCDYEINGLNNPFNDLERFGIHFVASPRHADMLLVTGMPTRNMEEALIKTYNATPDPKLVVAVGTCAISGGIFRNTYAVRNGIDGIMPVDMYIPGCPPRPQAILHGILKVLERVK